MIDRTPTGHNSLFWGARPGHAHACSHLYTRRLHGEAYAGGAEAVGMWGGGRGARAQLVPVKATGVRYDQLSTALTALGLVPSCSTAARPRGEYRAFKGTLGSLG